MEIFLILQLSFLREEIVSKTSWLSNVFETSEIPWEIELIRKERIDIDLSLSTSIVLLNFLIFLLTITEKFYFIKDYKL